MNATTGELIWTFDLFPVMASNIRPQTRHREVMYREAWHLFSFMDVKFLIFPESGHTACAIVIQKL